MNFRETTRRVKVGNVFIGGQNSVVIQSMCNIETKKIDLVVAQILELEKLGCQLIRVSVLDFEDAKSIRNIVERINIPLIADIHYNYQLAIEAIENGASKIRINPGNIGSQENVIKVIDCLKKHDVAVRIGANSGSINMNLLKKHHGNKIAAILESIDEQINIFTENNFHNIVLSLKTSDPLQTIELYQKAAQKYPYPLHIGLTESGLYDSGIIKSSAILGILLDQGIGDTIRISLTASKDKEIIACKQLLKTFNLIKNVPTLICCPTCGRTKGNLFDMATRVNDYLKNVNKDIVVAVMGCAVNGIGEGKSADIGIAFGDFKVVIFKKGEIILTCQEDEAYEKLIELINS